MKKWIVSLIILIIWCLSYPFWVRNTSCITCYAWVPKISTTMIIFVTGTVIGLLITIGLFTWEVIDGIFIPPKRENGE